MTDGAHVHHDPHAPTPTSRMSDNTTDPGSPLNRLGEADKQIAIVIGQLADESEHVDPDAIGILERALEDVRDVTEMLDEQARVTNTELRGGDE